MLSQGAALLMEMGTGKTKVVIDVAEVLYDLDEINSVLVIAPLTTLDSWVNELKFNTLHSDWSTIVGTKVKKVLELDYLNHLILLGGKLVWGLINVDGVRTVKEALKKEDWDLVIVDESTTIKNGKTLRFKAINGLFSGAKYKLIMSGNPIPKGPEEIFSQYCFIDPGVYGDDFFDFRDRYFVVDEYNKVVGFKGHQEKEEFDKKLHDLSFRKTKQECLSLPPKVYEQRLIEMSGSQKKVYEQMRKTAKAFYADKFCSAPVLLSQIMRLSQIAGGFFPGEGEVVPILPNPKLDCLVDLVEELSSEEQIVIWARFNKEVEIIEKSLNERGHACSSFYGKTSYEDRIHIREQFREKKLRIFIGSPATGGKGLNDLIGANTVIYYSNDYSAENRQQSEDRNHRMGTVKVLYIDLIMKNSIDQEVWRILKSNKDFSESILNRSISL